MKFLMLLSLALVFNAQAETDMPEELIKADEAIESPALNIEGQYHVDETPPMEKKVVREARKPRRLSASDKLRLYRERLELRNRIMVEKKMEQIRYQQELALARKLEQSMNQTLKAIEGI